MLAQEPPRSRDGESFVVEQPLDAEDHVHIFLAVEAMAAGAFDGLEHGKLGFPIAQNEWFQVRQAADFADAVEFFLRGRLRCCAVVWHRKVLPWGRRYRSSLRVIDVEGSVHPSRSESPPVFALLAFAHALDEADRRANVVELGAQLVFEEALIAEMQRLLLVGENEEGGWRDFRLRHVVDAHGASLRRGAALQVDFVLEPIVKHRRGDTSSSRFPALVDQRKEFIRALAGFRGEKNDRSVAQEFQFGANHFFILEHHPAGIEILRFVLFAGSALGFALRGGCVSRSSIARGHDGQIPLLMTMTTERLDSSA